MDKIIRHKKLFLKVVVLLLSFTFIALILNKFNSSKPKTIVLTKNGFSPAGIKIKQGTTVRFVSKIGKPFWPASDLHPSHALYSEFDPKRALKENEVWEFRFEKLGSFRFHDHISPMYRGTIIVVSEDTPSLKGDFVSDFSFTECKEIKDFDQKRDCFSNILQDIVLKKGPDITFDFVKKLRDEDPDFAAECHTIVHSLGEVSYWKYAKDKKLPKTGKISYCGFGYIHGFMQELGHHSRDFVGEVKPICDHFSEKLNYDNYERTVNPSDQCYHGVGHGLAFFYVPDFPYDITEAIKRSASDCQELTNDDVGVSNCTYGIFGGISSMYIGGHGIQIPVDEKNPFKVCNSQEDYLKDACFDSLVPVLGVMWNMDMERLSQTFSTIDEIYQKQSFYNLGDLASRWFAMGYVKVDLVYKSCRYLGSVARQSCFNGFSEGLIRNSFPKTAPLDALGFCRSSILTSSEKYKCEAGFLSEMKLVHPDKIKGTLSQFTKEEMNVVCEDERIIEYCKE